MYEKKLFISIFLSFFHVFVFFPDFLEHIAYDPSAVRVRSHCECDLSRVLRRGLYRPHDPDGFVLRKTVYENYLFFHEDDYSMKKAPKGA